MKLKFADYVYPQNQSANRCAMVMAGSTQLVPFFVLCHLLFHINHCDGRSFTPTIFEKIRRFFDSPTRSSRDDWHHSNHLVNRQQDDPLQDSRVSKVSCLKSPIIYVIGCVLLIDISGSAAGSNISIGLSWILYEPKSWNKTIWAWPQYRRPAKCSDN